MPPDERTAATFTMPVDAHIQDLTRLEWRQRRIDRMAIVKVRDEEQNENRRRYCVYAHRDSSSRIRYVGHGLRQRAWSVDSRTRTHRWMLACGDLVVDVLRDHLTAREAIGIEADLIEQLRQACPTLILNRLAGTHLEETRDHE